MARRSLAAPTMMARCSSSNPKGTLRTPLSNHDESRGNWGLSSNWTEAPVALSVVRCAVKIQPHFRGPSFAQNFSFNSDLRLESV